MNMSSEKNFLNIVLSCIKQITKTNYSSAEAIELTEKLSPSGHRYVQSIKFCDMQTNRICNIVDYLANTEEGDSSHQRIENFEIEVMLEEIIRCFSSTLSEYLSVNVDLQLNLKESTSIMLDKSKFELVMLNLLYCCIKGRPSTKKASPIKLSISVTENKSDFIFHIRDNNTPISPEAIEGAFSAEIPTFNIIDALNESSLIALSIKVASRATSQINGSLAYTPLKSGNRFDIALPKFNEPSGKVHSVVPYIPTTSFYNEFFADLKLELMLKEIPNTLADSEGM